MRVERTIPVYLGGPVHGRPLPPREELRHELFEFPPFEVDVSHHQAVAPMPEPARYVRRTYAVGDLAAHAWMHADYAGGLRDAEAARLMWEWLLDTAGVTS